MESTEEKMQQRIEQSKINEAREFAKLAPKWALRNIEEFDENFTGISREFPMKLNVFLIISVRNSHEIPRKFLTEFSMLTSHTGKEKSSRIGFRENEKIG